MPEAAQPAGHGPDAPRIGSPQPAPGVRFRTAWLQRRRPFRALPEELSRRLPFYADDWLVGLQHPLKVFAASLFMYFVSVFPALTFGNELANRTKMEYGIIEVLLSCAISGTIMALFSGQPLVVVGVTGPITAFATAMYQLARNSGYDFLPLMFWTCLWTGLFHCVLAIFNCCDDIVEYVTRYSCEIFGLLIAIIYIVNGISGVVRRYKGSDPYDMAVFLLVTLNTLVVTVIALRLSSAQSWWVLTPRIRFYIADWGVSIAIIFMWIIVSQVPPWNYVKLRKLPVPPTFRPTRPRPWLVNPFAGPPATPAFALLPAFILTTLILFDHNVSSLLAQSPRHALRKPPAYNLDFLLVGLTIIICGTLGLPPAHGLIPQATLHVESLVYEDHRKRPRHAAAPPSSRPGAPPTPRPRAPSPRKAAERVAACCTGWLSGGGVPQEVTSRPAAQGLPSPLVADTALVVNGETLGPRPPVAHYVVETRWSALLQSVAIGLTTMPVFLEVIEHMPPSLLYGSFIYMGIASFSGNQLAARLLALTLTEPRYRLARYLAAHLSPRVLTIPPARLVLFTALQFLCLLAIVLITIMGGPAAIAFPLLIMLLIPLRHLLFPRLFTPSQLAILDTWAAWPAPPSPADPPSPPSANGTPPRHPPTNGTQPPHPNTPPCQPTTDPPCGDPQPPHASKDIGAPLASVAAAPHGGLPVGDSPTWGRPHGLPGGDSPHLEARDAQPTRDGSGLV